MSTRRARDILDLDAFAPSFSDDQCEWIVKKLAKAFEAGADEALDEMEAEREAAAERAYNEGAKDLACELESSIELLLDEDDGALTPWLVEDPDDAFRHFETVKGWIRSALRRHFDD